MLRQALIGFATAKRRSLYSFAELYNDYNYLLTRRPAENRRVETRDTEDEKKSLILGTYAIERFVFMENEPQGPRQAALLSLLFAYEIEKREGFAEAWKHKLVEAAMKAINFVGPILRYLETTNPSCLSADTTNWAAEDAGSGTASQPAAGDYDRVLRRSVTDDHLRELKSAQTLWISGLCMRRTGNHRRRRQCARN